ncbi:MAG: LptF/LptG family permease [candidate division WOR-3 bacterium]
MKKVDAYFIKALLKVFFIIDTGSVFIFIVVNFFERLGFFIANKARFQDVVLFYVYQVPSLAVLMAPFSLIIAIFFLFQESVEKREILALKTAGLNLTQLLLKILALSLLLTLVFGALNEFAGYPGLQLSTRIRKAKIEKSESYFYYPLISDFSFMSGDTLFYFSKLRGKERKGYGVVIIIYDKGTISARIDADSCTIYKSSYELFNVTLRYVGKSRDSLVFLPKKVIKGVISPFEVIRRKREIEELTARELYRIVEKKKRGKLDCREELVEYYYRFSFPLAVFIFAIFSLPMAISIKPRGKTYAFGLALLISFVLWILIQFLKVSGSAGRISPFTATFLPVILTLAVGIIPWFKLRL